MPNFRQYGSADVSAGEALIPEWTKLPPPRTWEELENGVNSWLDLVWGPEWRCPYCRHRFWSVLEPVKLEAAPAWPIAATSNYGSYPTVPVSCIFCRQTTPVLLSAIFESAPQSPQPPEAPQ